MANAKNAVAYTTGSGMTKTFLVASIISLASASAAYWQHKQYDPQAEAAKALFYQDQISQSVASELHREQQRCLLEKPEEWCNRDLTYAHFLSLARSIGENQVTGEFVDSSRQARNRYALISLIAGLIAANNIWRTLLRPIMVRPTRKRRIEIE